MKLKFDLGDAKVYHQYCINCHAETVNRVRLGEKTYYDCNSCNQRHDRSIVIDPAIIWWLDNDKEYWHESAGVFIKNSVGRFLFFERVVFPFALTIPSGHVDVNEDAATAAAREVTEEVGLDITNLRKIAVHDIWGDQCRRGADVHKWHAYSADVVNGDNITLNHEGLRPQWMTLEEALSAQPIEPVRFMIERYGKMITS